MVQTQPDVGAVLDHGADRNNICPIVSREQAGNQAAPGTDSEINAAVHQSLQVAQTRPAAHQFGLQTYIIEKTELDRVVPRRTAVI